MPILAALLTLQSLQAPASAIELREGLAIRGVTRAGRSPVFMDGVVASMSRGEWRSPRANDEVVGPDGEKKRWEPLKAADDGAFQGNSFQAGYAHFEVERTAPEIRILESGGWGMAYVDGQPRAGDPYGYGYVRLPVKLQAGKTSFLFAAGRGRPYARLVTPPAPAFLNLDDPTLPDLLEGVTDRVLGGVTVVNASDEWTGPLRIRAAVNGGPVAESVVPRIAPLSFRKVPISIEPPPSLTQGEAGLALTLADERRMLDFRKVALRVRTSLQSRKVTFLSRIDNSVQYYGLNPALTEGAGKGLVLTLHGASVEGIGQADAYRGKDWCHIVAPTNRRPYGFDWEDVGRLDALEVLEHARATLHTDPLRTYLTGHSMGGHGAWINGFLFPDKWAAVAPAAGWISFFTYAGGQRLDPKSRTEEMLRTASNASDTVLWIRNALNYPVYIHHGDKDDNVPVLQAREMRGHLDKIAHPNTTLNEVPGAGHWFGGESVDWPAIFDLFQKSKLPTSEEKAEVDFTSANLAASSKAWWLQLLQQTEPLQLSQARFRRNPGRLTGTTENVEAIRFDAAAFEKGVSPRVIEIDRQTISIPGSADLGSPVLLRKIRGTWTASLDRLKGEKRPEQMGPFKEIFKNQFLVVYGTIGSPEETAANLSLARFMSETFGYRGNGSIRLVSDVDYGRELDEEKRRVYIRKPDVPNVLVLGSESTNAMWRRLLKSSPIRVRRGEVRVAGRRFMGADLGAVFIRPREGDSEALVGVIAASGSAGQKVLERLPYFLSGAHFPDWTVYSADMLARGVSGVRAAGFFRNDWGVRAADIEKR